LTRAFILKASEGRSAPDFSLKSLSGPGRMDLIARCIIAAFNSPGGTRRDVVLTIVLEGPPDPPVSVTIDGREVQDQIPAGEGGVGGMLLEALSGRMVKGVRVERKGFERVIGEYGEAGFTLYYLHEEGGDSRGVDFGSMPALILGDQKGLDPRSERFVRDSGAVLVSLGPHSYLASHCITIVNCELDGR